MGEGGIDGVYRGDDASPPTPTALSKAEYIKQGDAICAEVNAAVGSVGSSSSSGSASKVSQVDQVSDIYTGMVSSLKGLGTPEGGGDSEFISAAESLSKAEGEAKLADERSDSSALSAAETSATSALTAFQTAAQAYGFKNCSEGPKAPSASPGSTTQSSSSTPEATSAPEAAPEAEPAPSAGGAGEAGGATGRGGRRRDIWWRRLVQRRHRVRRHRPRLALSRPRPRVRRRAAYAAEDSAHAP